MPKTGTLSRVRKNRGKPGRMPVTGWREWAALPELGIEGIKVKIDTGARTSAVHAFNIEPFRKDGADWVRFDVHPIQRNDQVYKTCEAPAVDYRWVTNSGGGREKRFVVRTMLRLGPDAWPIEVTLTDRDQMGFRMLLGRTALEKRLLVDPALSFRLGKPRREKKTQRKFRPAHNALKAGDEEE